MSAETAKPKRIEIYDTTLRDGTQGQGVTLSLVDKIKIAGNLDEIGVDFIEGGYPLSNPKDVAFFAQTSKINFVHARICAFGMTRRKGIKAEDDPGMRALVDSTAPIITIVGKAWDLHVDEVLGVDRRENLDMISQSLAFCAAGAYCEQVFFDAEHFFDGYRANRQYALETLRAALAGGAARLVLCDTNGGCLPGWIRQVVSEVGQVLADDFSAQAAGLLAIHTHNDTGLAVANSLAAIEAGCTHVQGTINGIGERCGNVDLTTVAANLQLKLNYPCLVPGALAKLTELSRYVYELANLNLVPGQPYVGSGAFAHKGGMHVHAVRRVSQSYEHVQPEQVGNSRRILVSELSGASNIAETLGKKFDIAEDRAVQRAVLKRVQELENQGYQFEAAEASFELLLYDVLNKRTRFWTLDHYRCVIFKRNGEVPSTEAIVKLNIKGVSEHHVAEGDGPVNALDGALRKSLTHHYPQINDVHLTDYKVRVVNPTAESAAKVRVIAEFAVRNPDGQEPVRRYFSTIGVNENIVDASWQAIADAFDYYLIETGAQA